MSQTLEDILATQSSQHEIVARINLDRWYDINYHERSLWLLGELRQHYRAEFLSNQRILCISEKGDEYADSDTLLGEILRTLQEALNKLDISNFFVTVIMPEGSLTPAQQEMLQSISRDPVPLHFVFFASNAPAERRLVDHKIRHGYDYNSRWPLDVDIEQLTEQQRQLLLRSDKFCIYPWVHMFVSPNGDTYPCCGYIYDDAHKIGNTGESSLKEIWNGDAMKKVRLNMLNETETSGCKRCYEHEKSGFFSMRNSANKHHGKHISKIDHTNSDGSLDDFDLIYWDVRFNNLCNLRCRSCGPQFSSSWYQDQKQLAPDYNQKALIFAGKFETDLWEQLLEHMDHVETIYFAGGEPLMMDEHYRILEALEQREKFDVRLIYNTNFTQSRLGKRSVFDYWKKFKNVAVGASLDASGARAEYIRKGTVWADIEENRRHMIEICPEVDFYISATLSILNAWHLPDFHREWVEKDLIKARDFNINNLTYPNYYRIDVLPQTFKQELQQRYLDHLAWLESQDDLCRATNGFKSAINFMNAKDNSHWLDQFRNKTLELDHIRQESISDYLPELKTLL